MTPDQIADALWAEYRRVDDWPLQTEEGAHGAKCAIRCCATRMGVYPEFVARDAPDDFVASFAQTIADFEGLDAASKVDYERSTEGIKTEPQDV